ncbi:MAG: peptidylprolyl isomerase [Polyangiaceae bacterium]|nr:peptidylprolyl isomerase [Polyangiaceae bacterium]
MLRTRAPLLLAPLLLVLGCEEPPPAPTATPSASIATAKAPPAAPTPAPSAVASATDKPASVADKPEWITAQHVLVAYKGAKNAPASVKRSKDEAKKRAEEVAAKAKAGEDFTALVKEYSDDAATLDRLGSVGKFKPENMVKPFSDAAFALKVDATSDPVESPFGFHVIKRNQ